MPIRPYRLPDGKLDHRFVEWCRCPDDERRGPAGGVCWCGGAIPNDASNNVPTRPNFNRWEAWCMRHNHAMPCPMCKISPDEKPFISSGFTGVS